MAEDEFQGSDHTALAFIGSFFLGSHSGCPFLIGHLKIFHPLGKEYGGFVHEEDGGDTHNHTDYGGNEKDFPPLAAVISHKSIPEDGN